MYDKFMMKINVGFFIDDKLCCTRIVHKIRLFAVRRILLFFKPFHHLHVYLVRVKIHQQTLCKIRFIRGKNLLITK